MRLFRQTIADYTCSKQCGYHYSVIGADLSVFHLSAAALAATAWWLRMADRGGAWYQVAGLLAGEVALLFAAGFLARLVWMPFGAARTVLCRQCRAPMFFAGRHFDPAGSTMPSGSDIVVCAVFGGLNAGLWIAWRF